MEPPELTNFGSLVRHALQLEAASAGFYRAAEALLPAGLGADLARLLAEQHEGRRRLLERTRQQKLNEMVLEPLSGLDGSRYVADTDLAGAHEIRSRALGIEEVGARFYAESAVVAQSLLTEAARTFQRLADENLRNAAQVRETFSS
jgi:hypothetical protein